MDHVDSTGSSAESFPDNFEKAAMSGLQVCDGDNGEELTSHFPFGLFVFWQFTVKNEPQSSPHTLFTWLRCPGRLLQSPVALWYPS